MEQWRDVLLGATLIEVGVRIGWALLGSGLTVLGFLGLWPRLKALESRPSPNVTQSVVGPTIHIHTDGKKADARRIGRIMESVSGPTIVGRYDKDNNVIYVNTIHGRLSIRTDDPNATMSDLTNWLDKHDILETLEGGSMSAAVSATVVDEERADG